MPTAGLTATRTVEVSTVSVRDWLAILLGEEESATWIWNDFVACVPVESVASTSKLKLPVVPGVPEIVPVAGLRVRPAGSDPEAILKL